MIGLFKQNRPFLKVTNVRVLRVLTAAFLAHWIASTASAATIFKVKGQNDGSASFGENLSDKGALQSFPALQNTAEVNFGLDLNCLSCGGETWLMTGILSKAVLLNSSKRSCDA